jgi:hypothetical protein
MCGISCMRTQRQPAFFLNMWATSPWWWIVIVDLPRATKSPGSSTTILVRVHW